MLPYQVKQSERQRARYKRRENWRSQPIVKRAEPIQIISAPVKPKEIVISILSRKEVARIYGVQPGTLSKWWSKRKGPTYYPQHRGYVEGEVYDWKRKNQ